MALALDKEDRQSIFNKVVSRLRKQGQRARNDVGSCRYRQNEKPEDPMRCGIGHLIHDDYYFRGLEGHAVAEPQVIFALKQSNVHLDVKNTDTPNVDLQDKTSDLYFLDKLQYAHDMKTTAERSGKQTTLQVWEEAWQKIADDFGLTMPDNFTQEDVPGY